MTSLRRQVSRLVSPSPLLAYNECLRDSVNLLSDLFLYKVPLPWYLSLFLLGTRSSLQVDLIWTRILHVLNSIEIFCAAAFRRPLLICPVDDPVFRPLFSILFYYLVSVCTLPLGTPLRLRAFWLHYYQVYMYVVLAFFAHAWTGTIKVFRGKLLCLADTISCVIYMTTYGEVGVVIPDFWHFLTTELVHDLKPHILLL